jgi:hypothetical protein
MLFRWNPVLLLVAAVTERRVLEGERRLVCG